MMRTTTLAAGLLLSGMATRTAPVWAEERKDLATPRRWSQGLLADQEAGVSAAELKLKADGGDAQAMFLYARRLEAGRDIPKDALGAREYLRKAMGLGNIDALLATANVAHGIASPDGTGQDLKLALDCYLRAERLGVEVAFPSDSPNFARYLQAVLNEPPGRSYYHIRYAIRSVQDLMAGVKGVESYPAQRARLLKRAASGDAEAELRLSIHPGAGAEAVQHRAAALALGHPFVLVELAREERRGYHAMANWLVTSLACERRLTEMFGASSYPSLRKDSGPLAKIYGKIPLPLALAKIALTLVRENPQQAKYCLYAATGRGFRPDNAYVDKLISPEGPPHSGPDSMGYLQGAYGYRQDASIANLLLKRYRAAKYLDESEDRRKAVTQEAWNKTRQAMVDEMLLQVWSFGDVSTLVSVGEDSLALGEASWAASLFEKANREISKQGKADAALAVRASKGLEAANKLRLPALRSAAKSGDKDALWSLALIEASGLGAPVDRPAALAAFSALAQQGGIPASLNAHLMSLGSFPAAAAKAPLPRGFLLTFRSDTIVDDYGDFARQLRPALRPALIALSGAHAPPNLRNEALEALAQSRRTLEAAVITLTARRSALIAPVQRPTVVPNIFAEDLPLTRRAEAIRAELGALDRSKQSVASQTHSRTTYYDYYGIYYNQHSEASYQVSNWTPAMEESYQLQVGPLRRELEELQKKLWRSELDIAKAKAAQNRDREQAEETYRMEMKRFEGTKASLDKAVAECRALMAEIDLRVGGFRSPTGGLPAGSPSSVGTIPRA